MTGSIPSFEISRVTAVEAHTRAISSAMIAWVIMSAPAPPYGLGDPEGGQLQLDAGVEGGLGEGRVPVGGGGVRGDPVVGELPQRVPELAVGVGQGEGGVLHPHKLPTGSCGPGHPIGAELLKTGRRAADAKVSGDPPVPTIRETTWRP